MQLKISSVRLDPAGRRSEEVDMTEMCVYDIEDTMRAAGKARCSLWAASASYTLHFPIARVRWNPSERQVELAHDLPTSAGAIVTRWYPTEGLYLVAKDAA